MAKIVNNPLSQADYQKLNKQLGQLAQIRMEVQRAREAGFPCDAEDTACQAAIDQLGRVKAVYFPEQQ